MPHFRFAQAGFRHGVATLIWNSVPLFKGQTSYVSPRQTDIQDYWNLYKVTVKSVRIDPPKSVIWGAELHAKKSLTKSRTKFPHLPAFIKTCESQAITRQRNITQMANQTEGRKRQFFLVSEIRNTESVGSLQAGPISLKLRTFVFNKWSQGQEDTRNNRERFRLLQFRTFCFSTVLKITKYNVTFRNPGRLHPQAEQRSIRVAKLNCRFLTMVYYIYYYSVPWLLSASSASRLGNIR